MKVTLSFDNGPTPQVTSEVLDILRRHELLSTFFVIGQKLTQPPARDLCEHARDEGHWIGNHTFTHSVPLGEQPEPDFAVDEIAKAQAALGDLAHPDKLFRPFGGGGHLDRRLLHPSALDYLTGEQFTCVLWNVVPRDWENPDGWVETALGQIAKHDWSLVVLHDLPTGAMKHLDVFLHRAQETGAEFSQSFPPSCIPLSRGQRTGPIEEYVNLAG